MNRSVTSIVVILTFLLVLLTSSLFTVYESDRAIVSRLGELQRDSDGKVKIYQPGMHLKMPLVDIIHTFDSRLKMAEIPSERIVTKEKEVLLVDLFVQWRITDYALFYNTTHSASEEMSGSDRGEQLLRQNVKGVLHAELGQRSLQTVVSAERKDLIDKLINRSDENVSDYGMQVVDVRINRVEYPLEVNEKVFARMSSERKRVAVGHRASGESQAAMIRSAADKRARILVAEAQKEAEEIRGEGDSKASAIYAQSYNQSPEFYELYRSLEAYKNVFQDKTDIMVLRPDSEFFKYFRNNGKNE
jgi:membrane protease subunit HflC